VKGASTSPARTGAGVALAGVVVGLHAAARIGANAESAELLVSTETLAPADGRWISSQPRLLRLKGFPAPREVLAIDWRHL
jgi:hypothetical protein